VLATKPKQKMKTKSMILSLPSAFAVMALLCATSSRADQSLSATFHMPVHVNAIVDESGCNNNPGPTITVGGTIALGGIKARVILANNVKGTHQIQVVNSYDVNLLVQDGPIEIPKQPVLGGVGGNPHIYLQFHDGKGQDLSDEFYLGRCVQGMNVSADMLQAAVALANVHSDSCSNRRGPRITLGGDITLGGLHAKIIFRNNVKGTHTAETISDVAIVLEGTKIVIPKQPSMGGVGGNPLVYLQFLQGNGESIGDPVLLGRCNKI